MAKKKRKKITIVPDSEAKEAVKKSFREMNWKTIIKLILLFALFYGFYQFVLQMAKPYGLPVYETVCTVVVCAYVLATTVLGVVYIILNKGISNDIPTKEMLRDDWSDEKKEKYIEELTKGKKKARKLLFFIAPLVFTLLIDMLMLLFFAK